MSKKKLTKKQKLSIEMNSYLCKEILGDEYRHVHEVMEGVHKRKKRK